jgi:DNA-binding CsgD family transcriptional regulator
MAHQALHPLGAEALLDEQARRRVPQRVQAVSRVPRVGRDAGGDPQRPEPAAVNVDVILDAPFAVREHQVLLALGAGQPPFAQRVMNRTGESIVRLEDGLVIRNGLLNAGRVFETTKLGKLILAAAFNSKTEGTTGRMLIRRSDYRPAYVLTVAPLCVDAAVDGQPLAMIVVIDPRQHTASEKDLAEFFGFSPAEARLSVALMTGQKLCEIAPDFGLKVTTLRTQLRSILKKAGAARQSDLVRILSSAGIGSVPFATGWLDIAIEALAFPLSLAGV